jgi:hypothetical protein
MFTSSSSPISNPQFLFQSSDGLPTHITRRSKCQPTAPMLVSRDCPYRRRSLGEDGTCPGRAQRRRINNRRSASAPALPPISNLKSPISFPPSSHGPPRHIRRRSKSPPIAPMLVSRDPIHRQHRGRVRENAQPARGTTQPLGESGDSRSAQPPARLRSRPIHRLAPA